MDFDIRDRLLLAFANLASYGIAAHSGVTGSVLSTRRRLESELREAFPEGDQSYVFWLESDEERVAPGGVRPGSYELPLYYHSRSGIVHAVASACADVGIEIVVSVRAGVLHAREAR